MFVGTDRFRLVAELGRGSMGVVYQVHDVETDSDVALKTLGARAPDEIYHLKQEFRILTGILDSNLVELYELVVSEQECFFTMELVDGVNFVDVVQAITPAPGVAPTATPAQPDCDRFVNAACQLVSGLSAVHAAGKLHRDVKPSNVLVTRDGRVVLLDFGLATALGMDGARHAGTEGVAGTLVYMAPECLWGNPPTPAADWYGVGAVFYEALTGQPPFAGPAVRVLQQKQAATPPHPSVLVPTLPVHLDALVIGLLDRDPRHRPTADDILQQLTGTASRGVPRAAIGQLPFVGRSEEITRLHALLDDVAPGRPAVVHVIGPSGIGKSELLRRFLANVEQAGTHRVLRGRCHPQELIPYKALDTVIDGLSHLLLSLPPSLVATLVPPHASALIRLFPVLERVPGFAVADDEEPTDAIEVRRQGFRALRELLVRLSARQPLVVWIDDIQWGDADSAALLREVLQVPGAAAMLLVLSYRSEDRATAPLPDRIEGGPQPAGVHAIELGPLDVSATRDLAAQLCAAQIASDRSIEQIVAESAGNPFFISELARSVPDAHAAGTAAQPLRLAHVMHARMQQLSEAARELLAVVSITGGPIQRSLALSAAGLGERGRPLVSTLERRYLLRSTTVNNQPAVEVYHDRLREALIEQLAPERRSTLHRRMAETLRQLPDADPQALFTHYLGAGDTTQAGHYAALAADTAARALAFDRAAQLYRQALDLRGDDAQRPALLAKLAEALANAGRGLEAGDAFETAAQAAQDAAAHQSVLDLRRQAAEHYLRSGHLEQGFAVTRAVLQGVGVRFPETNRQAFATVLRLRLRMAWRGVKLTPRHTAEIAPAIRLRLAACRGASWGLGSVDLLRAEAIGVRHLLEALDSGDRSHSADALLLEAIKCAQFGGKFLRRRAARLLQMATALVAETNDPYDVVGLHFTRAAIAYQSGEWRATYEHCEHARAVARERWTGLRFERVTIDAFSFSALACLGELQRLAHDVPDALAVAEDRGDHYAALGLRAGLINLLWLAHDRAYEMRTALDTAITRWPTDTFLLQHYLHLIATVHCDLYCGDAWAAWRRVQTAWPKLRAALFLMMESPSVEMRNLRARTALAAATADASRLRSDATPPDVKWTRQRLLRLAQDDARALARCAGVASAQPLAILIRAGIAAAEGHRDDAVGLLHDATTRLATADMKLYAAAAGYCEGALRGGAEGQHLMEAHTQWMRDQGVQQPAAMVRVLCPISWEVLRGA